MDWETLVLPGIISGIIAFLILGLQRFGRTSDDTVEHTIQVKNIEVKVTGFEAKFRDLDDTDREIWRKLDEINAKVGLHEYRLDRLDKNGHKTPI